MSNLFISYRRDDSADVTGRLHDRLKGHFGDGTIFLDIDNIPFGLDFRQSIGDAVNQCDVLLAVIGDHWLDARYADGPQQGCRRLDDPNDYMRIEIGAALARGIPVVPLLVGRASMPAEAQLPDGLKELAFRNAAQARSGPDFHEHVDRLIRGLEQFLVKKRELRAGVEKATYIASEDPQMALGRARMVLELLVRDVYERWFREPPGTRPLESLIERLGSEGGLPDQFDAGELLRRLNEAGAAQWGQKIATGDVHQSLTQLTDILKWYIEVQQPDALGQSDAHREKPRTEAAKPTGQPGPPVEPRIAIVPKGLRSFDANDSDFFLQLLPGPRDKDGLPESIRFWKHRIESLDDPSFTVGVIYGPSGCGKSSLVKAGILPRVAGRVVSVYVEATAGETEARILSGLRKKFPDLDASLDLTQTILSFRNGHGSKPGQKVVLVVDQFEQWLHAHGQAQETELAEALRQCDGEHVQCLLLVRDDFWVSLSRFMGNLRIEILQGRNTALVDLFDLMHARDVLIEFGRAFGRLPVSGGALAKDQETFLTQAIEGLAQDGRVISIRLALFAEMVRGKPWVAATLKEVGGTPGVGVSFLEETFGSAALRAHQKAGQAVLKALLPEGGSNIKGNMRSHQELLQVSGYANRPHELDALLRVLDRDLRLITPTEAEGTDSREAEQTASTTKYYQLTHDYLVPSLREWLRRKQSQTRRGRAALRLAERAALWSAKPESRRLPSVLEWASIRALTPKRGWTETERRMMKRAGRFHGLRSLGLAAVAALLAAVGLSIRNRVVEANQATAARGLVQQIVNADTAKVPDIIRAINASDRRWTDPELRRIGAEAQEGSREKLHASLALLPVGPDQTEYLYRRLLNANPHELPVIRTALDGHQADLLVKLRAELENTRASSDQRFCAACALAGYVPGGNDQRWQSSSRFIVDQLLASAIKNPSDYAPLLQTLRPIRERLLASLSATYRDKERPDTERSFATNILTDYASDQPAVLADLLMDSGPKAYSAFFPIAQRHDARILSFFQTAIASKPAETEEAKDRLAERQARAAVALVRLGRSSEVWPLLRHSADPRLRSFIVNWLSPLGADPKLIAAELDGRVGRGSPDPALPATAGLPSAGAESQLMDTILFHPETSIRRALILALGSYGPDALSPAEREPLITKLVDAYTNDPDAGIHGAAEWTLRQWNEQAKLKANEAKLIKLKDRASRRWLVNTEGQTFALIEGPVEFTMGSPPTEPDRDSDEDSHRRKIPRRFAIAAKEVSVRQYQEFVRDGNSQFGLERRHVDKYSPDPDGPMIAVSWFGAVAYCNWLSKREGLPEDHWCYLRNKKGEYAQEMTIPADVLKRKGYRLPTEAEWEYACRAGASTSRYHGLSLDLLAKYAHYTRNGAEHAWPGGSLLPNDLGLFDMMGNVFEWCGESSHRYATAGNNAHTDNINTPFSVDMTASLLRGGAFASPPAGVRSAFRLTSSPRGLSPSIGFRLARTYD
jgi:eukaryotic-like serine/threonine-protein kinase